MQVDVGVRMMDDWGWFLRVELSSLGDLFGVKGTNPISLRVPRNNRFSWGGLTKAWTIIRDGDAFISGSNERNPFRFPWELRATTQLSKIFNNFDQFYHHSSVSSLLGWVAGGANCCCCIISFLSTFGLFIFRLFFSRNYWVCCLLFFWPEKLSGWQHVFRPCLRSPGGRFFGLAGGSLSAVQGNQHLTWFLLMSED